MGWLQLDAVRRLCRKSGKWIVIRQEGDVYDLRSDDAMAVRYLSVRHRPNIDYLMFQAALPLRFPLDRTPSGLFARMLLRNVGLKYCHWNMDLLGSFEATAFLYAQWPIPGMSASFFNSLCREMTGEIADFHQELRDKFRGDWGVPATTAPSPTADVRMTGPMKDQLTRRGLGRMLPDDRSMP